jgi:hypothetical protein
MKGIHFAEEMGAMVSECPCCDPLELVLDLSDSIEEDDEAERVVEAVEVLESECELSSSLLKTLKDSFRGEDGADDDDDDEELN